MKRLLSVMLALVVVGLLCVPVSGKERKGKVTIQIELNAPEDAKDVRLWLPYPVSDEFQTITDVHWEGNYKEASVLREPENGLLYLYAKWEGPSSKRYLNFSFKAHAKERAVELRDSGEPIPADVKKYLEPEPPYILTDGKIAEIAKKITRGKKTILEKARAVYDWTVENTFRDPKVKGCGLGIVEQTLAKRGGKCADISTVFVSIARAAGVPARDVFGLRLGKKPEQDMTKGYHCWAEFYLPGTGWVPVDPADVRKIMLIKKLCLKEAEPYRQYYFGRVDEFRIALEWGGRAVNLMPEQKGKPLTYLMYPYAEVDGKPLDFLDPKNFRYKVHFKEL
ncbi:MAG: transglutaminase [Nitrospirae bacterium]|nr:MAG: transglutaminase [Nitrospirota bacterium]